MYLRDNHGVPQYKKTYHPSSHVCNNRYIMYNVLVVGEGWGMEMYLLPTPTT